MLYSLSKSIDTLKPRQYGYHFTDGIFKFNVLSEYCCTLIALSVPYLHNDKKMNKNNVTEKTDLNIQQGWRTTD